MRRRHQKKGSFGKIMLLLLLLGIIGGAVYLYNSSMFEQKNPQIHMANELFWNLKKPIPITISDESGVKFVRATLSDGTNTMVLSNEVFKLPQRKVSILANFPRTTFFNPKSNLTLNVETFDNSKWNFFMGNKSKKSIAIKLDTTKPELYIVNNSYSIVRGGAGTVVFKAGDDNLDKIYIKTDAGDVFKPQPFYKDGYYISFVAWRHNQKDFSAHIVAVDKAGNETKERVKFYLLGKRYRTSKIPIKNKFIDGKVTELAKIYSKQDVNSMSKQEKFKFTNETLRNENEEQIKTITSKVPKDMISNFHLFPFYPLKNAARVASFGDHRYYRYKNDIISESYHLGLDLASTSMANIVASNSGTVVFAKDNGIYGNNLIISHGMGVYSLYAHCSNFKVSLNDKVKRGEIIARTGLTGLVLGDHLHFGIIVQGQPVRPEEWMDPKWFIDNVTMVIKDAKKIINRK